VTLLVPSFSVPVVGNVTKVMLAIGSVVASPESE